MEPVGELHEPERLPVALRVRHAEAAEQVLLRVTPLLLADHHHRPALEPRQPGHDRRVVREVAVAVQLHEAREARLDVVERVRSPGMARDLHALVAREPGVDLAPHALGLLLQLGDLALGAHVVPAGVIAQLLDLLLQLEHRLLEVQPDRHAPPFPQRTRQLGTRDLRPAISPSCAPTRNRRERMAVRE